MSYAIIRYTPETGAWLLSSDLSAITRKFDGVDAQDVYVIPAHIPCHDADCQPLMDNPFGRLESDVAWACIRARRDALLAACDWTQMADSPLSTKDKAAWTTYRQALRDIPGDCESPLTVTWPVKPE